MLPMMYNQLTYQKLPEHSFASLLETRAIKAIWKWFKYDTGTSSTFPQKKTNDGIPEPQTVWTTTIITIDTVKALLFGEKNYRFVHLQ